MNCQRCGITLEKTNACMDRGTLLCALCFEEVTGVHAGPLLFICKECKGLYQKKDIITCSEGHYCTDCYHYPYKINEVSKDYLPPEDKVYATPFINCTTCGKSVRVKDTMATCEGNFCFSCYYGNRTKSSQVIAESSAYDTQVGGSHYKNMVIQPAKFNIVNKIPWVEGECIAKLCRWRDKGGIEDLRKVQHAIDMLIEEEEKQAERKKT
jgi:hypothetical protein